MKFYPIVLCAIIANCDGSNSIVTDPPQPRFEWLHLEAIVEPKVLEFGAEMRIRLDVTNTSEEVQSLSFGSGCVYGFTLRNKQGDIIAPPPPICTMNAPVIRFQPLHTETVEMRWVWDDAGIEPGVYYVVAGTGARGESDIAPPIEVRLEN